jgi:hypothetical protein
VKDEEDEKKEETCAKFKLSKGKLYLDSVISFVDSNRQYNKHYLMLKEMMQDVVKERYKRETQTKICSFLTYFPYFE